MTELSSRDSEEVAEELVILRPEEVDRHAETHLELPQHPRYEHQGKGDERHHHAVDRPALLHDAAVQNDETRHAHQPHKRGGSQLPGVVTGAQPGWIWGKHGPPNRWFAAAT